MVYGDDEADPIFSGSGALRELYRGGRGVLHLAVGDLPADSGARARSWRAALSNAALRAVRCGVERSAAQSIRGVCELCARKRAVLCGTGGGESAHSAVGAECGRAEEYAVHSRCTERKEESEGLFFCEYLGVQGGFFFAESVEEANLLVVSGRSSIVIVHPSLSVFSLCDSIHIVEKNKKCKGGNALFSDFP